MEHILPCIHDVSFVACPTPSSLFSVSASFLLVLLLSLPPEWSGLCLPPCQQWGGTLEWMWLGAGKRQWGYRRENSLHLLEEVQCARLDISAPQSDGGGQRGAIVSLCISLNSRMDLATSSWSWPLMTSKGQEEEGQRLFPHNHTSPDLCISLSKRHRLH